MSGAHHVKDIKLLTIESFPALCRGLSLCLQSEVDLNGMYLSAVCNNLSNRTASNPRLRSRATGGKLLRVFFLLSENTAVVMGK